MGDSNNMDETTRKAILGEILTDEIKAMHEYLKDLPSMKADLHQVKANTEETNHRLTVLEAVVREHEQEIRLLKHKMA